MSSYAIYAKALALLALVAVALAGPPTETPVSNAAASPGPNTSFQQTLSPCDGNVVAFWPPPTTNPSSNAAANGCLDRSTSGGQPVCLVEPLPTKNPSSSPAISPVPDLKFYPYVVRPLLRMFRSKFAVLNCQKCGELLTSESLVTTNCHHIFHASCLDPETDICPVCYSVGPHKDVRKETAMTMAIKLYEETKRRHHSGSAATDRSSDGSVSAKQPVSLVEPLLKVNIPCSSETSRNTKLLNPSHFPREMEVLVDYLLYNKLPGFSCQKCAKPLTSHSLVTTRCNHIFHRRCLLSTTNKCPYCKGAGPHENPRRETSIFMAMRFLEFLEKPPKTRSPIVAAPSEFEVGPLNFPLLPDRRIPPGRLVGEDLSPAEQSGGPATLPTTPTDRITILESGNKKFDRRVSGGTAWLFGEPRNRLDVSSEGLGSPIQEVAPVASTGPSITSELRKVNLGPLVPDISTDLKLGVYNPGLPIPTVACAACLNHWNGQGDKKRKWKSVDVGDEAIDGSGPSVMLDLSGAMQDACPTHSIPPPPRPVPPVDCPPVDTPFP